MTGQLERPTRPSPLRAEVGFTFPGEPHEIGLDVVRTYVDATNDDIDMYERHGVAPPVYGAVASMSAHSGLLLALVPELQLAGAVHLGQTMRFHEPVALGSTVTSNATLVETRSGSYGCSLTMLVELFDAQDRRALEAYHRVLLRGVRDVPTAGSSPLQRSPKRSATCEHLGTSVYDIGDDLSLRYADASGDHLPIHTDPAIARLAGFSRLIVHGMCTLAMAAQTTIRLAADRDPTRLAEIGAMFTRPVLVGEPLEISVERDVASGAIRLGARQAGQAAIRDANAVIRA